jgi:serine-type D-Ala-D-Ala carboxypeptidase/endopeptidase (penicillin-binding protein 4)
MAKPLFLLCALLTFRHFSQGQEPATLVGRAFEQFSASPALRHAIAALYVSDARSGETVYARNADIGLAPASAQKVVTAAAFLDLLGKSFQYQTIFGYTGSVVDGVLDGRVIIRGSGDPSLGSPRYPQTRAKEIGAALTAALRSLGIREAKGGMLAILPNQESQTIPNGWIWEDIANYYGAGHGSLNWKENQFDLLLKPGSKSGEPVRILNESYLASIALPAIAENGQEPAKGFIRNELVSGPKESGDEAYLFFQPGSSAYVARGSVPCCVDSFRISGAVSSPEWYALREISLLANIKGGLQEKQVREKGDAFAYQPLYVHKSPEADSLVFWFLQKSINLYGEAFLHTIAQQKSGYASYEEGLKLVRQHWMERGIDTGSLQIMDGSGLSPQNRVTAKALTQVMLYARKRPWHSSFYAALPTFNGIRMKSGTIGGAKTFTGYIKSKSGQEYAFAIMVNNFEGPASAVVKGMYAVLDQLK